MRLIISLIAALSLIAVTAAAQVRTGGGKQGAKPTAQQQSQKGGFGWGSRRHR